MLLAHLQKICPLALEVALGQPLAKSGYEIFQAFIAVLYPYFHILT
jgi:hypothetical protein